MAVQARSAYDHFMRLYSTDPIGDHINLEKGERTLENVEKGLNICGWIPFISTTTSTVRGFVAMVQVVAGLSMAIFKTSLAFAEQNPEVKRRLWSEAGVGIVYFSHGIGNAIRAFFESIPLVNLVCLGYDLTGTRFRYSSEVSVREMQTPGHLPFAMPQFPGIPTVTAFGVPLQFGWQRA